MKYTAPIIALVITLCAAAEGPQPTSGVVIGDFISSNSLTALRGPTHFYFQSGIDINVETGEVQLPKSLKLSDAARSFWMALADSYPNVRYDLMHPPISSKAVPNSEPSRFTLQDNAAEVGRIEFGSAETSTVRMIYKGADVLKITGLPRAAEDEVRKYDMRPFIPPEAPESITVELTTKDGKVWRAKWVEKP